MKRVFLCGRSIFLTGLAGGLETILDVQVTQRPALSGAIDLTDFDLVVVDFDEVAPADVLAILRARPDLKVVGVSPRRRGDGALRQGLPGAHAGGGGGVSGVKQKVMSYLIRCIEMVRMCRKSKAPQGGFLLKAVGEGLPTPHRPAGGQSVWRSKEAISRCEPWIWIL
ncbi:MAG TPA: hypothetical protein ENN99_15655 [Chloroflexi bacterium]|nr:hypothetical protein [Chloroflexota bacterium]